MPYLTYSSVQLVSYAVTFTHTAARPSQHVASHQIMLKSLLDEDYVQYHPGRWLRGLSYSSELPEFSQDGAE